MGRSIPPVKVPHDRNAFCIGCPNRKVGSCDAFMNYWMGPQNLPKTIMGALVEEVQIDITNHRRETVRIVRQFLNHSP